MSSIDHIRATPGFSGRDWPKEMSLEANRQDLIDHARDFEERVGFTYSVLDVDEVIGCVYIYPSRDNEHDANIRSWVTEAHKELDIELWSTVSDWITTAWPFTNPEYAPRV